MVTGEGREDDGVFRYSGMDTGGTQVGRKSCEETGRKNTDGETRHQTEGAKGGAGPIRVRNNKRRSLGPEWLMPEVGTPRPHNLDKRHGLVTSIKNKNNIKACGKLAFTI